MVIPLINWSGKPVKGLKVRVVPKEGAKQPAEATLATGRPLKQDQGAYLVDLDDADALILR
jgi:hypothetical protein